MASHIGPADLTPNQALGEFQYAYLSGAATYALVTGSGTVHTVVVGVAGTLLKLYDVAAGGTTDSTTQIATIDLAGPATGGGMYVLDVAFSKGLTAIVTGSSAELMLSFRGTTTTSARTFIG
jgi:hypothetical protein